MLIDLLRRRLISACWHEQRYSSAPLGQTFDQTFDQAQLFANRKRETRGLRFVESHALCLLIAPLPCIEADRRIEAREVRVRGSGQ
jgi:hypothetical protein